MFLKLSLLLLLLLSFSPSLSPLLVEILGDIRFQSEFCINDYRSSLVKLFGADFFMKVIHCDRTKSVLLSNMKRHLFDY